MVFKGHRIKPLQPVLILLALLLSACGTVVVDKSDPNYIKFEELCRTKAGTHIYETVDNVEGVYGIGPNSGLLKYGYKFVEYEVSADVPQRNLKYTYVTSPGLYRYTLENANHPNCHNFYKLFETSIKAGHGVPEKFGGKCVAMWPIEKATAKYRYFRARKGKWEARRGPGDLSQMHDIFSSIDGRKIYAENHLFNYVPLNSTRNFSSGNYTGISCPDVNSPEFSSPNPSEIFKPIL